MHLIHLSLTNFRNFSRVDMDVPRGALLLVGANAQGKTSLLEAIYFLATFTSFHASNDRELINFLSAREPLAVGRIVADFQKQSGAQGDQMQASGPVSNHRLEVRLIQESNGFNGTPRLRKEVLVDGMKRKFGEALGVFNAVLFLPHMLRVVEGAPEERRRYLNIALAQVWPWYGQMLSEYTRALSQRNALLKQLAERGGDSGQLVYWDQQVAAAGARLIHGRIQAIHELEALAARFHSELTRGREVLRLAYEPAYDPLPQRPQQLEMPLNTPVDRTGLSLEKIQTGFMEQLDALRGEEIARGVTTIGPHRDELRFLGNGIDLGTYGSRGQARTVMLAMKLAEVEWMRGHTGEWPVLLLDEVLAELDTERRTDLLTRLSESEQALLTTTDLDLFSPAFVNAATLWYIQNGRLEEVDRER